MVNLFPNTDYVKMYTWYNDLENSILKKNETWPNWSWIFLISNQKIYVSVINKNNLNIGEFFIDAVALNCYENTLVQAIQVKSIFLNIYLRCTCM